MKTPKRKPAPRTHLPRMNNLELEALQARLMRESGISIEGKTAVMLSMRAAANPRAESPEVVISTLESEERENVQSAMIGYQQTLSNVGARGRNALMFDAELDLLIAQDSEGDE
jgi:hypothetical protein